MQKDIFKREGSRTMAFVSVDYGYQLRVRNIRVNITNDKRELVCCPSIVSNAGVHIDVFHPTTRKARENLNEIIWAMYRMSSACDKCKESATVWYPLMHKWLCGAHDLEGKYFLGIDK